MQFSPGLLKAPSKRKTCDDVHLSNSATLMRRHLKTILRLYSEASEWGSGTKAPSSRAYTVMQSAAELIRKDVPSLKYSEASPLLSMLVKISDICCQDESMHVLTLEALASVLKVRSGRPFDARQSSHRVDVSIYIRVHAV